MNQNQNQNQRSLIYRNNTMVLELCMRDVHNAVFKYGDMYIFAYGVSFNEGKQEVEWQHGSYNLTFEQARERFVR